MIIGLCTCAGLYSVYFWSRDRADRCAERERKRFFYQMQDQNWRSDLAGICTIVQLVYFSC